MRMNWVEGAVSVHVEVTWKGALYKGVYRPTLYRFSEMGVEDRAAESGKRSSRAGWGTKKIMTYEYWNRGNWF